MTTSETEIDPARRREVMTILPGLVLAVVLAMLDNMIIGTALPRIVGELGGLAHLSWVVTAYVLGMTVSTPIWGKIGDLYGRKGIFLASIVIFLIGSMLSGMAGTDLLGGVDAGMAELIAFRALQGLGAGGLLVNAMAILGDLVPPRDRGRYQGIMAAMMSLALVAGPLVGGVITDNLSWRWAFYINLPLGGVALALIAVRLRLPRPAREGSRPPIDWWGAILLGVGITALVLITTWGGAEYAWGSPQILGLAAVAVAALAVFVPVERRAAEPIMPPRLFRNRNFVLISVIGFLLGFAMFGAINFVPLFQQTVQGASATNSGVLLLPMMLAAMVVSLIVGSLITRTGRYKIFPVIGGAVVAVAMWLLSLQDMATERWQTGVFIAVLGLGMGFLMQTTLLITQNSVEQRDLGAASSGATFFRSIGGSFGVSLFGAVFNQGLTGRLTDRFGADAAERMSSSGGQIDAAALAALPAPVRTGFLESLAASIGSVFWWAVPFAAAVVIAAAFIVETPLRTGAPDGDPEPARDDAGEAGDAVRAEEAEDATRAEEAGDAARAEEAGTAVPGR
jgi:EmrB/QacA subfamily drug resistance transporter